MKQKWFVSVIIGYVIVSVPLIVMWMVFIKAYLSNSKSVIIYINRFGEMYFDWIAFIFITIMFINGLYYLTKIINRGNIYEEKTDY